MKSLFTVFVLVFFCGCKSITTEVHSSEDNHIIMKSTEKWTFFDPEEKLKFVFSPNNGGQILSLSWEGQKAADKIIDSYPNKENNVKDLKPRIIDDGSGLIVVDSTVRGNFQLRRSYSLKYLENTDEHVVEVIYNVKNYSSDSPINQQWIQTLSLPASLDLTVSQKEVSGKFKNSQFKISAVDVYDLEIENEKNSVKIGNKKSFNLGFKEKLTWKVKYSLKNID